MIPSRPEEIREPAESLTGYVPLIPPAVGSRANIWNKARTQVALVGLICFCCPGMWNSITSMAGGIDPTVSSNATSSLYACFTITSVLAPAFCNRFGPKLTLFVGTWGYVLYAVALLLYHDYPWASMVVGAGAINGVGAGLLWTAQGQMMLAYPTSDVQGEFVAVFWIIFNLGAVAGGAISLGANYSSTLQDPSKGTYMGFIGVMVVGSLLCLALAHPADVERPNGKLVTIAPMPSWAGEVRAMGALLRQPMLVGLGPLFLYSNWFYTYQFGPFSSMLFNARTQGLANMAFWGAQMGGSLALGRFLDSPQRSVRFRGTAAFIAIAIYIAATWALTLVVNRTYHLDRGTHHDIDFTHYKGFLGPFLLYFAFGLSDSFIQCWCYWLFGKTTEDSATLSRFTGIYKAVQSAGGAISWKLNGSHVVPSTQIYINVALVAMSMPVAIAVANRLPGRTRSDATMLT